MIKNTYIFTVLDKLYKHFNVFLYCHKIMSVLCPRQSLN